MNSTFRVYAHYSQFPMSDWRWDNFSPKEMACRGPFELGGGKLAIVPEAMDCLQDLRNLLGLPLTINSAYRTPEWNAHVGGVKRSAHLKAEAFDLAIGMYDPAILEAAGREVGFTGFGFYPRQNFIHMDIKQPREWGKRWFTKYDGPPIKAPERIVVFDTIPNPEINLSTSII